MNKKIKIFLGAYVNFANAQNINCDNIAKYLDKDKFEVHTMYTTMMPIDKKKYKEAGIKLHRLWHRRIVWKWSKLWAMRRAKCDIYYLPKIEEMDITFAKKHKGKGKVFLSSVEGVITETTNNTPALKDYFLNIMDESFAISNCIAESVKKFYGEPLPVLPLGVLERGEGKKEGKTKIHKVVWVGNVKENKRPMLLVECAKRFPQLQFIMIGDGDMQKQVEGAIQEYELTNLILTGRIPNEQVYEHMQTCDVLLMTSEFEGLPKVIQEAALNSLPSIYINENYTVDFIQDGVNGYGVANLQEMQDKLQYLLDNPEEYQKMSSNAFNTIQKYRWSVLIKEYETYFEDCLKKYGKK
ncbi:MAG: glycosyltransferase [Clostridiales bacterium]|nr:glycosyltransferase [Clostridiales bacterium]